jgi:hypothetical protein
VSTAVVEKPKAADPVAEKPAPPPFEAPKVRVGQQVRFYRNGEVIDGHAPEIAFVIKGGNRALSMLKTIDGWPIQTVYHISDPKLRDKPNLRANGAWDFIEEEIQQRATNAKLLEAVAMLTARVIALENASKK